MKAIVSSVLLLVTFISLSEAQNEGNPDTVNKYALISNNLLTGLDASNNVFFKFEDNTVAPFNSFSEIREVLFRERPQTGDQYIRKEAICNLDDHIGDYSDPTKETTEYFFDRMLSKALFEIKTEDVTEGATVWQLYNHGYVVKTQSALFGFDLRSPWSVDEKFDELAELLDACFISHMHGDHYSLSLMSRMTNLGKPVVVPSEWANQNYVSMSSGDTLDILNLKVIAHYGLHNVPVRQFEITTPEGIRILHTGDNQTSVTIPEVSDINILLLNAWVNESGTTSSSTGVKNAINKVQPDVCLLGHIQEFIGHEYPLTYREVIYGNPPPEAHVLAWGERFHFADDSNDTIRPNTVENIRSQISQDSIYILWDPPTNATDGESASLYRIIMDNHFDVFLKDMKYGRSWDSIGTYNFKVFSYDHCGNQSKYYVEIDVELTGDTNYRPRIRQYLPEISDTIDLYLGVHKIFCVNAWDPNEDTLHYLWKIDQEPIEDASSSNILFNIIDLESGVHQLSCIVSDGFSTDQNMWLVNFHRDTAIIDNGDSLMYTEQGWWKTLPWSSAYNETCRYSSVHNTGDWAQFDYYPGKTGSFSIFQKIPKILYALNDALYCLIVNDHVLDSVYLDQSVGTGDWVKVGHFILNEGDEVGVRVINTGSSTSGNALYADAIKFEFDENVSAESEFIKQPSNKSCYLKCFPNPFKYTTMITIPDPDQIEKIEITGLSGRIIRVINDIHISPVIIHGENLPDGVYCLKFYSDHNHLNHVMKIIKL
ncbi:MAG: hypothetical protein AMS23_08070 [Bacteroides sp. SM1_62]|nr:MAG: hypothetical protein AMS23_08070 [Bacteroides sp. SM1_62]